MSDLTPSVRHRLRDLTPARVSLAATGNSLATAEILNFQLAHAQARDAVHAVFHTAAFAKRLEVELPVVSEASIDVVELKTNAPDRAAYLRRPDLGRTLHPESAVLLRSVARSSDAAVDLAIVVADGLSTLAVERNVIPLLASLLPRLLAESWTIGPMALVQQGRVAVGDPIGQSLSAALSLVLIGERPGLSASDSLGAYLTWHPHPERTDADRNCMSNIRDGALSPEVAASRLLWYLDAARTRQVTGTALKEGSMELDAE